MMTGKVIKVGHYRTFIFICDKLDCKGLPSSVHLFISFELSLSMLVLL